jgi:hypothetical protein
MIKESGRLALQGRAENGAVCLTHLAIGSCMGEASHGLHKEVEMASQ